MIQLTETLVDWVVRIGELAWLPFSGLSPNLALGSFSFFCGILILLLYRLLSPEARIRRVNERILGELLEVWYARDSLAGVLAAQGRILRLSLLKLALLWKAILGLGLAVVWMIAVLAPWCEWQPVEPGEPLVLTAVNPAGTEAFEFSFTGGMKLGVGPVVVPALKEVSFRVVPEAEGEVTVRMEGVGVTASPVVGGQSPLRRIETTVSGAPKQGGNPASRTSLLVRYPAREWSLARFRIHWIWFFSIFAILGAVATAGAVPTTHRFHSNQ